MKKTMIYQIKKSGAVLLGWALSLVLLTMIPLAASAQSSCTLSDTPTDVSRWIESRFAKGKVPPFSFVYDGKPSAGLLRKWKYMAQRVESSEPGVREYLYSYQDRRSGLKVECRVKGFADFGAVEWVLNFKNLSDANSATIEQVKVVDLNLTSPGEGGFTVHYADGSHVSKADFHQRTKVLAPGDSLYMAPEGGRSSQNAFPFFNIEAPDGRGAMVAVGWSGTWFADVAAGSKGGVTLSAGQKNLSAYLYPSETIRTPSVCLLFWQGENRFAGHNAFRRFILAHHTRKIDGKPARYPVSTSFNYGDPAPCNEYTCLTTDYAIALIRRYEQFDIVPEVFWLDAGWYEQAADYKNQKNWANTVGNWKVDRERFPDGLKPVADEVHRVGAKFMVWFEPERVVKGSQWAVEHPEWMVDVGADQYLFDLGNPEAREWMCDYIGDFIEQSGIDYYRQDFNMEPAWFWAKNDGPRGYPRNPPYRRALRVLGLSARALPEPADRQLRERRPADRSGERFALRSAVAYRLQLRGTGRLPVPYLWAGALSAAARNGRAEYRQVHVSLESRHVDRVQLEDFQRFDVVLRYPELHGRVRGGASLFL